MAVDGGESNLTEHDRSAYRPPKSEVWMNYLILSNENDRLYLSFDQVNIEI
jgi:hypothetical protein